MDAKDSPVVSPISVSSGDGNSILSNILPASGSLHDTAPTAQSPQLGANVLKPPLPILSTTKLYESEEFYPQPESSTTSLGDLPAPEIYQLTTASSSNSLLPSLTVADRPDTLLDDKASPLAVSIPPRSADHETPSSTLLNPRTRNGKPASLTLISPASDAYINVATPLLSANRDSIKQIDLLSNVNRSSSAPSTPAPPFSKALFERGKDGAKVASPLSPVYPSFDNCTFNELKHTLSEKLIQLSQVQSQNAQLWTLVNKQRTMIFDLQKDLDGAVDQNEKYRSMLAKFQSDTPISSPIVTDNSRQEPPVHVEVENSNTKVGPHNLDTVQKTRANPPSPITILASGGSTLHDKPSPVSLVRSRRSVDSVARASLDSKRMIENESEHSDSRPTTTESASYTSLASTVSHMSSKSDTSPWTGAIVDQKVAVKNTSSFLSPPKSSFDFNTGSIQPQHSVISVR